MPVGQTISKLNVFLFCKMGFLTNHKNAVIANFKNQRGSFTQMLTSDMLQQSSEELNRGSQSAKLQQLKYVNIQNFAFACHLCTGVSVSFCPNKATVLVGNSYSAPSFDGFHCLYFQLLEEISPEYNTKQKSIASKKIFQLVYETSIDDYTFTISVTGTLKPVIFSLHANTAVSHQGSEVYEYSFRFRSLSNTVKGLIHEEYSPPNILNKKRTGYCDL